MTHAIQHQQLEQFKGSGILSRNSPDVRRLEDGNLSRNCPGYGDGPVRNHVKLIHVVTSHRGFSKGTVLCGGY